MEPALVSAALGAAWGTGIALAGYLKNQLTQKRLIRGAGGDPPSLAVVIASRNEEAVIENTIRRVFSSSPPGTRVIVVDESTDSTPEILARLAQEFPDLLVIRDPEVKGKPAALNRALKEVKEDVVLLLDADARVNRDYVQTCLSLFADPDLPALFTDFEEAQHERGAVSEIAHESIDGALTVKALGREKEETERFGRAAAILQERLIDIGVRFAGFRAIVESLPAAMTIIILVVGAVLATNGVITAGQIVSVAYLLTLMAFPLQLIGFVIFEMAHSQAAWTRVQEILDSEELVDHGTLEARTVADGAELESRDVGFSYTEGEPVLSDIQLEIPAGRTVAVVGPTASGKSTLAMLLARLWDPDGGSIRIDGRDVRAFARTELALEVAYVAQESFLFDDTVWGNVTLGSDVPESDVLRAMRLAGVERFITELPDGYDTRIGERGTALSGGQRQRIALARALVRRPRVLVLDDATSAVDPSVEIEILRGLQGAELPSTVVIVAYRRSSIMLTDEVVFMEEGRVVAHGSHEELLASQPGYERLLRAYEEDAARRDEERRA